ncbi:hypothetical protein GH714_043853 [Hevea brasiliensis]|uniref:Replication protein A subunit n=1 Tax=Hevea brasiliensis TaxID=3981 RepID=A0A6A6K1D6_HEVBR|nr:hypothetical protein GH714_043853 [Hevea brasiliensis]
MGHRLSPDAIATLLSNPKPDSLSDIPEIIVQITKLEPKGKSYGFDANDGKMKIKAIFNSRLSSEITSGNIQNLGLIRILDYTVNEIPSKSENYLIITKCEVVSPAPEMEIKDEIRKEEAGIIFKPKQEHEIKIEVKKEPSGILLKPKREMATKSAAQIVHEQHRNMAPTARMAMTRRVHPLVSLNPYQGNWTIKVRVTSKGNMRTYKNARGEGCVFNVELTDEDKRASNEAAFIPETKFNFVPIDQLGPYINSNELVDVIGVIQSVSPTMSIRRKSNNEIVPKRDITIADETKKTVVVSLWNDLATNVGQELLDLADNSPVVAIKSLKVGDFQGVSLSTLGRSIVQINPDTPESNKLRCWYDSDGKETSMASVGSGLSPSTKSGASAACIFSIRAYISFIKPDQSMWYRACKTCNKKVTEAVGDGYWCEGCQKNDTECSLRYILVVKVSDASGEGWVSVFNEAEKIIGCSADELDKLKSEKEGSSYQLKLKEATWNPHLFRVSVAQNEYNNEKRQRITVRAVAPVDFAAESRYLLEEISKMKDSP